MLPFGATETINPCLLPLDGPGLGEVRKDMLLALIVRTRRKRPGDAERDAERRRAQQLVKKSKLETVSSNFAGACADNNMDVDVKADKGK